MVMNQSGSKARKEIKLWDDFKDENEVTIPSVQHDLCSRRGPEEAMAEHRP